MGSVGNTSPWAPYNTYKDCSHYQICSIYCPQYCYLIFPPPPSAAVAPFSPLIIAVISVLATAFLLVCYYTVVTTYCRGRRHPDATLEATDDEYAPPPQCQHVGMDEALIKRIAVRRYRKGERAVGGTECAVCLTEFQENEILRVLPKCIHAFHVACIDTWLKSHSVCPLCRANVIAAAAAAAVAHPSPPPPPPPIQEMRRSRSAGSLCQIFMEIGELRAETAGSSIKRSASTGALMLTNHDKDKRD